MTVDEWDTREVCPDGACTGVIGPEGTCKVCGRVSPTWNNERERGLDPDAPHDHDDDVDAVEADAGDEPPHEHADLEPDADTSDWGKRELCMDGACVGVITDSGACSVCGKTPA